ncbi:hypothetical protein ACIQU4_17995 [Streptomyces sp. NPDC090741]|uniref:hypothetical protein n=1 Tax=Streptomyces sp. NPDC090741 TaxID=3365967 RepID=UPI00381B3AAF
MKIFSSKGRLAFIAGAAMVTLGVAAAQVGAFAPTLQLRGEGTYCLAPDAASALKAHGVTLEAIAPATVNGDCVAMSGAGTLAPDLSSGEVPIKGGMRFSSALHRLDITNLHAHVGIGEGSNTADVAQDGGPATNIDFIHWPVSLSNISMTPTSGSITHNPVTLTPGAAQVFTNAFGTSPTAGSEPLFYFDGKAKLSNPFSGLTTP